MEMMDQSENRFESEKIKRKFESGASSSSEEHSTSSSTSSSCVNTNETTKKTCADCGTSKTPLWRSGPAGPKSLCNACGIKSRKRRQAALGGGSEEKKPKRANGNHNNSLKPKNNDKDVGNKNSNGLGNPFKLRFLAVGREALNHRSIVEKHWRKLGEEERAAVLLMALSCGSVYA